MPHEDTEYLRRREGQERAAAQRASSLAARRVHQEMAELFALSIQGVARETEQLTAPAAAIDEVPGPYERTASPEARAR